mgnify:FL=1
MTVIDDRQVVIHRPARREVVGGTGRVRTRPVRISAHRPAPARPAVAPLRYRGTGTTVSRAAHPRKPVSTTVTVALAGLAALITLWLGCLAHFSGTEAAPAALPDQLAVVQVQAGETLQQLAGRVAPDAPAGQVMQRIRELNKLDSASLDAGQTLIAPLG